MATCLSLLHRRLIGCVSRRTRSINHAAGLPAEADERLPQGLEAQVRRVPGGFLALSGAAASGQAGGAWRGRRGPLQRRLRCLVGFWGGRHAVRLPHGFLQPAPCNALGLASLQVLCAGQPGHAVLLLNQGGQPGRAGAAQHVQPADRHHQARCRGSCLLGGGGGGECRGGPQAAAGPAVACRMCSVPAACPCGLHGAMHGSSRHVLLRTLPLPLVRRTQACGTPSAWSAPARSTTCRRAA